MILIEDLSQITVHGANIRLSTMDLSILSRNKVSLMTLDEKYLPRREIAHVLQNRKASEKHYWRIDEVKPKTVGVNCHIMI